MCAQVYTKNRCMRTVGSSKIGSVSPFVLLGATAESGAGLRLQSLLTTVSSSPYVYVGALERPLPPKLKRKTDGAGGARAVKRAVGADGGEHDGLGSLEHDAFPVDASTLPAHFTRLFVRDITQVKSMPISERTPPGEIPPAVRLQLLHGHIQLEDVAKFYIEDPKQCPADLITGQKHTHANNNALAVVVRSGARAPDVYVKCFCDCRKRLAAMHKPDPVHKELPRIEGPVKLVLETVWGLGNVADRADREAVMSIYRLADAGTRARHLENPETLVRWTRILPVESWCFIPVAQTMSARLTQHDAAAGMPAQTTQHDAAVGMPARASQHGSGARMPAIGMPVPADQPRRSRAAPSVPAVSAAARCKVPAAAAAPHGAHAPPTVIVCPFVGDRYEVLCPVCASTSTTTTHFDGARLRTYGSSSGECAVGHAYRVRLDRALSSA